MDYPTPTMHVDDLAFNEARLTIADTFCDDCFHTNHVTSSTKDTQPPKGGTPTKTAC